MIFNLLCFFHRSKLFCLHEQWKAFQIVDLLHILMVFFIFFSSCQFGWHGSWLFIRISLLVSYHSVPIFICFKMKLLFCVTSWQEGSAPMGKMGWWYQGLKQLVHHSKAALPTVINFKCLAYMLMYASSHAGNRLVTNLSRYTQPIMCY